MIELSFMVAAQLSFVGADILFMRSVFCKFHPLVAYWVFHLPVHYLNSLFLFELYRSRSPAAGGGGGETYQWRGGGGTVFGLHLKALVQISTNFCMLLLIGVFKEPLSDSIADGLDVYLLASTALLIVYAMIISSYLPNFDFGVSLTASLTAAFPVIWLFALVSRYLLSLFIFSPSSSSGLYMSMLFNMSGVGFEVKGMALVVLLSLIVIKIYVEIAIERRNRHGLGLHVSDRPPEGGCQV